MQKNNIILLGFRHYLIHNFLHILRRPVQRVNTPHHRHHVQLLFQLLLPESKGRAHIFHMLSRNRADDPVCLHNLFLGVLIRKLGNLHMAVSMVPNKMPLLIETFDQLWIFLGILPNQKKCTLNSPLLKSVQQPASTVSAWTVIKGDCDTRRLPFHRGSLMLYRFLGRPLHPRLLSIANPAQ